MARNTKHKARHNKSLFSCGSKWWWSRSKRRKLTIFGAKRQILMNNPRVHSQTAQNLNVKKGLIRHHQRLEITMTREAFYQPSKFESVQYFGQYLHSTYLQLWSHWWQFKMFNLAFGWLTKVHRSHLIPVAGGVGERDWGLFFRWFLFSSCLI